MDRVLNKKFILSLLINMAKKGMNLDFKTLITILIIVGIIAGVAYVVLTYEEPPKVYNIDQVFAKKASLMGEEIIVEGYYYTQIDGPSLISATFDSNPNPTTWLPLNIDNVLNATEKLVENSKYEITGILQERQNNPDIPSLADVELLVTKIST